MLSQQATDLLIRHPGLIIVETDDEVLLRGLIKSKNNHFHINISCPNFPSLKDFKMLIRNGFIVKQITETNECIQKMEWSEVNELISNLETLSEQDLDKENKAANSQAPENIQSNNNAPAGEQFYAEIVALHKPNFYDIKLNAACTFLRFCKFSVNEQHFLDIELPDLKIHEHSLPDCLELPDLLTKCDSLTDMVENYQKIIEGLQPFYEQLYAIDELCHVLQPAKPTTKHNYRLFVLRERVFLKLVLSDPLAPLSSMSVNIIGSTAEVEQLRHVYSEGLKNWDAELDIQKNLLRIFDLCYFPMPPAHHDDEQSQPFCNICYSYRLRLAHDDNFETCEVPVVSCDNPQCTLIFHDACLLKWFCTLTDNVSFLNVPFGDCPFCKAKLSTSFEQLRSNA